MSTLGFLWPIFIAALLVFVIRDGAPGRKWR